CLVCGSMNRNTATRMQSLSLRHSIQEWLTNALRTRTAYIAHRSNLENILQQFPHMCGKIETIEPYIRPPIIKIRIEKTKNDAKIQHDRIQMHPDVIMITIYTDGSDIENKIGAAVYNSSTNEVNRQYLGSETE